MARYSDNIYDQYRRPVKGAEVYVYNQQTGALAILEDDSGAALPNPVASNDNGFFYFNADDGVYTLRVVYAGVPRFVDEAIQVGDGIPLPDSVLLALEAPSGAALVGSSGPSNVQADINAFKAAETGPGLIGFSKAGTYAPGSIGRYLQNSFGNSFNPLDYGAIAGGYTGNAATDLAIAQANRIACAAAIADLKAAVAAGRGGCTFVLPREDLLIATAPFAGSAPPSEGVSAVGGGHYVGAGQLPLSDGWSCHGLVFDSIPGRFRIAGDGGVLRRIENDPFNTETPYDQYNSTIFISRSSDFNIDGELIGEGYQMGGGDQTTSGNFIDISYGCENFEIAGVIRNHKGTNALAIGWNRASGYSGSGLSGVDISQPCIGWNVNKVVAFDGEHAVFVNVADQWTLGEVNHRHRPYTYGGAPQINDIQRGVYLLSCGYGQIGRLRLYDFRKSGLLLAAYDSRRAYRDLNVSIDDILCQAPGGQDADYYIGVAINDQNRDAGHLRTIAAKIGRLTTRGVKNGVFALDTGMLDTTTTLRRFHVDEVDIQATQNGFSLATYGQVADISVGQGCIRVAADSDYHATAQPIAGLQITSTAMTALGAAATHFNANVRIGAVLVISGNRACHLTAISGLTIAGATFNYEDQSVPGAVTAPLTIQWSKLYGVMDYRTNSGAVAAQTNLLEPPPSPVRGSYRRTASAAPGTLSPGQVSSSNYTVNGARVGMPVTVVMAVAAAGIVTAAAVTADDTVAVTVSNVSSVNQTPGTITLYIDVLATLAPGT